jgi:hypothetical protein
VLATLTMVIVAVIMIVGNVAVSCFPFECCLDVHGFNRPVI